MKLAVIYNLTDEQEKRLEELVKQTEQIPGCATWTSETMFEAIMTLGSAHDINERMDFYENSLRSVVEQMKEGEGA